MASANPAGIAAAPVRPLRHWAVPWALVPVFVLVCYQFDWLAWRSWMRDATVSGAAWFGLQATPVGPTAFQYRGTLYFFTVACTAIDACFGAVPFFLTGRKGSLYRLAACFAVVAAANVARQVFGLVLYSRGVPWWLAHSFIAGVFYFLLLLFVLRERDLPASDIGY